MERCPLQYNAKMLKLAINLYQSGLSIWEVGEEIGYSGQTINRVLESVGVTRRHGRKALGSLILTKGRVYIKTKNGWRLRYRHKLSLKFGERAIKGKHIHHRNDKPFDDRITNLKILTPSQHRTLTNKSPKMRKAASRGWEGRLRKQHENIH